MQDTSPANVGRRSFLRHASLFAIALPALEFGALGFGGCNQAPSLAGTVPEQPANVAWKTTIVAAGEPGEPLIVSGTIYSPDGRTPLEGINLFVYQTDATGVYSTSGGDGDNRGTRIHGLMRSNKEGRYEFRTIKPGSYPNSRNAAHIHAYVSGPDYPEYWIDEYLFDGDPFISSADRQKFGGKGLFPQSLLSSAALMAYLELCAISRLSVAQTIARVGEWLEEAVLNSNGRYVSLQISEV